MRSWGLRPDSPVHRVARRGTLGLALLVTCSTFGACGGHSKSNTSPSAGEAGAAGGGGIGVAGGAAQSGSGGAAAGLSGAVAGTSGQAGSSGAVSGAAGVTSGTGGETGAAGAVTNGGTSGRGADTGGAAGDDSASAGESAGGAGAGCRDLCSESTPACCAQELRCVERVPRCRIDVLAGTVGVVYEYPDLQAKIGTLSGVVELTIPLGVVEHAAADPPPAARIELTLAAEASTAWALLTDAFSQPFRLSCDEQELLVGVIYMQGGAAAIQTPVLHAEQAEDGTLLLRLGAWQGAWLFGNDGATELRERLDRAELRAELCSRGILAEIQ